MQIGPHLPSPLIAESPAAEVSGGLCLIGSPSTTQTPGNDHEWPSCLLFSSEPGGLTSSKALAGNTLSATPASRCCPVICRGKRRRQPPGSPAPQPHPALLGPTPGDPRPRGTSSAPRPRSPVWWDTQGEDSRALGHDGRRARRNLHTERGPTANGLSRTSWARHPITRSAVGRCPCSQSKRRGGGPSAVPSHCSGGAGDVPPGRRRDLSQEGVAWDTRWDLGWDLGWDQGGARRVLGWWAGHG